MLSAQSVDGAVEQGFDGGNGRSHTGRDLGELEVQVVVEDQGLALAARELCHLPPHGERVLGVDLRCLFNRRHATFRLALRDQAAEVAVGEVDRHVLRPCLRMIEMVDRGPAAPHSGERLLGQLLGYAAIAAVEAEDADQSRVLGAAEGHELVVGHGSALIIAPIHARSGGRVALGLRFRTGGILGPGMKAVTVSDAEGRAWRVEVRWLPWAPRWRGPRPRGRQKEPGDTRWYDWLDFAEPLAWFDEGLAGFVTAIVLVMLLVMAVLFVLPAFILLVEFLIVVLVVAAAVVIRVLFRRPWIVDAFPVDNAAAHLVWKVVGTGRAKETVDIVAQQLASGIEVPQAPGADLVKQPPSETPSQSDPRAPIT